MLEIVETKKLKIDLKQENIGKPIEFIGESKLTLISFNDRTVFYEITPETFVQDHNCLFRAKLYKKSGEEIQFGGSGQSGNVYRIRSKELVNAGYIEITYPSKTSEVSLPFKVEDIELP